VLPLQEPADEVRVDADLRGRMPGIHPAER